MAGEPERGLELELLLGGGQVRIGVHVDENRSRVRRHVHRLEAQPPSQHNEFVSAARERRRQEQAGSGGGNDDKRQLAHESPPQLVNRVRLIRPRVKGGAPRASTRSVNLLKENTLRVVP